MYDQDSEGGAAGKLRQKNRQLVRALVVLLLICGVQLIFLMRASRVLDERIKLSPTPVPADATASEPYFQNNSGPWGELRYANITLEPPNNLIPVDPQAFGSTEWFFEGFDFEKLKVFLSDCGLNPSQWEAVADIHHWTNTPAGTVVFPGADFILSLDPAVRGKIYMELGHSRVNTLHVWPVKSKAASVDDWFADARLSQSTLELLKKLVYRRGEYLCFSDLWVLYPRIADLEERRRLVKFFSRTPTVLMKLKVKPDSDVARLADYWVTGPRQKDVETLLESLTKVPEGITLDIAHLLPAFARKRLYTFPVPSSDPNALNPNCSWTAMNFYNETPDDQFYEEAFWLEKLNTDYAQVNLPTFGDLLVFFRPDGQPIHVAVYVADDIVFTKNGSSFLHPWVLMKWDDLTAEYTMDFTPKYAAFRLKARQN